MSWLFLFIASLFEICWLYSLKFLDWSKFKQLSTINLQSTLPLAGYIVFGICNIIFYSKAMKTIPASTAFAVWLGMSLIGSKIVDIAIFKEPFNVSQLLFLALILAGIGGLKFTSAP